MADAQPVRRRLEYVDDRSNKFWEAVIVGNMVISSWGRIGTAGQAKPKTFSNLSAAMNFMATKIREKLREGYLEVTTDEDRARAEKVKNDKTLAARVRRRAVAAERRSAEVILGDYDKFGLPIPQTLTPLPKSKKAKKVAPPPPPVLAFDKPRRRRIVI